MVKIFITLAMLVWAVDSQSNIQRDPNSSICQERNTRLAIANIKAIFQEEYKKLVTLDQIKSDKKIDKALGSAKDIIYEYLSGDSVMNKISTAHLLDRLRSTTNRIITSLDNGAQLMKNKPELKLIEKTGLTAYDGEGAYKNLRTHLETIVDMVQEQRLSILLLILEKQTESEDTKNSQMKLLDTNFHKQCMDEVSSELMKLKWERIEKPKFLEAYIFDRHKQLTAQIKKKQTPLAPQLKTFNGGCSIVPDIGDLRLLCMNAVSQLSQTVVVYLRDVFENPLRKYCIASTNSVD